MKNLIFVLAIAVTGTQAYANEKHMKMGEMMNMTPAQRDNMAILHEKMATCLRTTKEIKTCKMEMKDDCQKMGKEACPMMMMGKDHDRY